MTEDRAEQVEQEKASGTPGAQPPREDPAADAVTEPNAATEPERNEDAANGPDGADTVEQDLSALVEEARSQRDEYLELAQRTKADFDNYRKRMAAENQAAAERGRLEVVADLIEAIDNLERVLDAAEIDRDRALEEEIPADAPIAEQGVIVVWRDLHAVLRKAEVEVYSPAGERFDPTYHEALQAIPAEDSEPGTVVEVMQRGYRSGENVLRPARVVVTQ